MNNAEHAIPSPEVQDPKSIDGMLADAQKMIESDRNTHEIFEVLASVNSVGIPNSEQAAKLLLLWSQAEERSKFQKKPARPKVKMHRPTAETPIADTLPKKEVAPEPQVPSELPQEQVDTVQREANERTLTILNAQPKEEERPADRLRQMILADHFANEEKRLRIYGQTNLVKFAHALGIPGSVCKKIKRDMPEVVSRSQSPQTTDQVEDRVKELLLPLWEAVLKREGLCARAQNFVRELFYRGIITLTTAERWNVELANTAFVPAMDAFKISDEKHKKKKKKDRKKDGEAGTEGTDD